MADKTVLEMIQEMNQSFNVFKEMVEKKASKEEIDKVQNAMDAIEVKMQRVNFGGPVETKKQEGTFEVKQEHKAAYEKFCRQGGSILTAEEIKTMTISNDTTGGYLASYDYDNAIIKDLIDVSELRPLCRVSSTGKRGIYVPIRKGVPTAYWTGEGESSQESQGGYGLHEIDTHSMTAKIVLHQDNLDDSDFDLAMEIQADAVEQFGVLEGKGFLYGDTKKKPEGILFNPDIPTLVSAGATAVSGDDLLNLFYEIKTRYSDKGAWLMNRKTIRDIRKLKDSQGRYIWTPMGGIEGLPYNSINGRPYKEMPDMPDIATGAKAIAFGDLQRGYRIVDRKGIETTRDNLTRAGNREVIFFLHKRVGGMVVLPQAMVTLTIK